MHILHQEFIKINYKNVQNKSQNKRGGEKMRNHFFTTLFLYMSTCFFLKMRKLPLTPISLMIEWLMRLMQSLSFCCEIYRDSVQ